MTVAEALQRLEEQVYDDHGRFIDFKFPALRSAVTELCGTPGGKFPTPRSLGNRLKHLRGRVVGGKSLMCKPDNSDVMLWSVQAASGSTGSTGSISTYAEKEIIYKENNNIEIHIAPAAGTDPADPAAPDSVKPFEVSFRSDKPPSPIQHKRRGCSGQNWWKHVGGDVFCGECVRPTELLAVAKAPASEPRQNCSAAVAKPAGLPSHAPKVPMPLVYDMSDDELM
jgi:hypothetical protein